MSAIVCRCCEPAASPTPLLVENRPGLSAVVFRMGSFSGFRQAMLQAIAGTPELAALGTRLSEDYSITLLDLWAVVADVLTFYQERLANEGFLRTARLRDSVLRLARLIDYQLAPGAAATALLAFTLETAAAVRIPVGLRVQSVPGQDEKPQKFETLEALAADARLNRLRVLPVPVGVNPLARGRTEAILAPGEEGLAAARALAPGDRILLFTSGGQLEEILVREVRYEDDRAVLGWSGGIQGAWGLGSTAFTVKRTFRPFGYNAPPTYMKPTQVPAAPPIPAYVSWELRTLTTGAPGAESYGLAGGADLPLDARYEEIKPGTRLLVCAGGSFAELVTVRAVVQTQAAVGSLNDTVTRLTVFPQLAARSDRRTIWVHELDGPPVRFWGYDLPGRLAEGALHVPVHRLAGDRLEIGRSIARGRIVNGLELALEDVDTGRRVILTDAAGAPLPAEVTRVAAIGAEVRVAPTPQDATTALQLRLDPDQASTVVAGIASALLIPVPFLSNSFRRLTATVEGVGTRTLSLAAQPTSLSGAATQLQGALNAADTHPAFAAAQVLAESGRLIVVPGAVGARIGFGPGTADETTVVELGLQAGSTRDVTALASAPLSPPVVASDPNPELAVTIGPIGPRVVQLGSIPSLVVLALEPALRAADPSPAFAEARVTAAGNQLLILPGPVGAEAQEFLRIDVSADGPVDLDARAAVLLGNVVLASHGETVRDEALGDGDASAAFQRFTLRKRPLTYVPSADAGGVRSSLRLLVNRALWKESPTLFGRGRSETVYTTRMADDGTVTVQFGDGKTGAVPPSGRGNVVATYRQGIGLAGRVRAGTLTTLLDRPVGLRASTNPLRAEGGADPETLAQARANAPTTVRTFGRAVALRDFEYLVASYPQVAKARATWVWDGAERAVHLTVAGEAGGTFSAEELRRIHGALGAQRDPNRTLLLDNFTRVPIVISATLTVAADRVAAEVEAASRAALLEALSFDRLEFGRPLHRSDLYAVLHTVEGVVAVDLDLFHFKDRSPTNLAARGATADPLQPRLRIHAARPNPAPPPAVLPAEQAWIEAPAEDVVLLTSGGLPA